MLFGQFIPRTVYQRNVGSVQISGTMDKRENLEPVAGTTTHNESGNSTNGTESMLIKPRGLEFKSERTKEEHIKYFRQLVADEIFYENSLVNQWEKKLKDFGTKGSAQTITEDGADQIRLAIGQSRLFLKQKMQQFVGLVDECEKGSTTTTPTDLVGFWEMIYMQVKNIHARFDHLDVLAENGWMTPQKAKTAVDGSAANGPKKVIKKPAVNVQASSKIREAIEKARAAKAAQTDKETQFVAEI